MYLFEHPNVLSLIGVCLDGGPAPYIIVPFMANGSLLAYLKSNRMSLVFSNKDEDEELEDVYDFVVIATCVTLDSVRTEINRSKLLARDWLTCAFRLQREWSILQA